MTIPYIPAQRGTRQAAASWRVHAACADSDVRMFFPSGTLGGAAVARAKAVCARCCVREACLDWALATGQRRGVWGGRLFESAERVPREY